MDLGWLPAHTSCNAICAVTKSQIMLSKGGPVPRAPLRRPATRACVTASASRTGCIETSKHFHSFLASMCCGFKARFIPNHLIDPICPMYPCQIRVSTSCPRWWHFLPCQYNLWALSNLCKVNKTKPESLPEPELFFSIGHKYSISIFA